MGARVHALVILAIVSAVLLMLNLSSTATFTAPTANPSNQVATATLSAPTGVSANVQSNGGTVRIAWTPTSSSWASGHRVYRSTTSGSGYVQVSQIAGLATATFDDVPGTGSFYYVVRGYYDTNGANWDSASSAEAIAKPLHHFAFAAVGTQMSGSAFSVTITAQAQDNSTVAGFTGTVALSTASGTISPTASNAFTAGVRTQSVTVSAPYTTTETITATGGTPSRTGTSAAFTMDKFKATAIALQNGGSTAGQVQNLDRIVITFNTAVNTATVGTCSGATNSGTDLSVNSGQNGASDSVTGNGSRLSIGSIGLGAQGYMQSDDIADASTCAWSAGNTVLTITLQGIAAANTTTVAGASTATYTPNAAIQNAGGAAIDTTAKPSVTAVLF
jgi:hypothetical protein